MQQKGYHITSSTESDNEKLLEFERGIVQGSQLKMEIVKNRFSDRASVFSRSHTSVAYSDENKIIGLATGAETNMIINSEAFKVGIGFDSKVAPEWRNIGVGRELVKATYKYLFRPCGLDKNIITTKFGNKAVFRLIGGILKDSWYYRFVYLTLPTHLRVKSIKEITDGHNRFNVCLFEPESISSEYYQNLPNGLSYFRTDKLYGLRIIDISKLFKTGIWILKLLSPRKYKFAPEKGDMFSFVTLYNHTPENISGINAVLEELERKNIKHLMVCCRKGDTIYKSLKGVAIDKYKYAIVSDFELKETDNLTIDVRCL